VEIDDEESFILARHRVYRFAAMVVFLILMAGSLGAMLYLCTKAASQASATVTKVLATQPALTSQSQTSSQPLTSPADDAASQDATAKTLAGSAKFLARLAWLSAALMGLTLLALFGVVTHFVLQRIAVNTLHERTEYVNAWSLAGQRVQPMEDDDDLDADEDDDEGEDSDEKGDDGRS
jgi:hypothetical protein